MKDFVVFSLGCKVNDYEGQAMINRLSAAGYSVSGKLEAAFCYIINTCSVTSEADKKSRQAVARVLSLNSDALVYVCGCSTQNDATVFAKKSNVRIVGGAGFKADFIDKVIADYKNTHKLSDICVYNELPDSYEDSLFIASPTDARAFIKVQDGCNNFCSYCIIPHLRGASRSRSIQSVLREAKALCQSVGEIVVSGINLSAYGKDIGSSLEELIYTLGEIPVRKRFGSLECDAISDKTIKAAIASGFCEHFHLSMQSGSDSVLKRMNRKYTMQQFMQKVQLIRQYLPNAAITTDIICGFPQETEQEHEQTMQSVLDIGFSDAHVFVYSQRRGTPASKLPQVEKSVKIERARQLSELVRGLRQRYLQAQIGRTLQVYFEQGNSLMAEGYSSNYIKVYSAASVHSLANIKITATYKDGLTGELAD